MFLYCQINLPTVLFQHPSNLKAKVYQWNLNQVSAVIKPFRVSIISRINNTNCKVSLSLLYRISFSQHITWTENCFNIAAIQVAMVEAIRSALIGHPLKLIIWSKNLYNTSGVRTKVVFLQPLFRFFQVELLWRYVPQ